MYFRLSLQVRVNDYMRLLYGPKQPEHEMKLGSVAPVLTHVCHLLIHA